MYISLHVKCPTSSSDFIETSISSTEFRKIFKTKFRENPSSGRPVVPYGLTGMTKLTVAFHNFANSPKMTNTITCYHRRTRIATREPPERYYRMRQYHDSSKFLFGASCVPLILLWGACCKRRHVRISQQSR